MFSLVIQASEEGSKSIASKIGYAIGYLVGADLIIETLIGVFLVAAIIIYWTVFRKKNLDW